ncbi:hypothetical protein [Pontibacillus yanchengensis]|uniref:Uncharacterized protein n=1 Tax=Pontibacillus yanchengensis Y32 TaxID=1385514 RepID=A0A0A2TH36_9BACI|nr:hypothetical protein [Pontibacillus yanchengensis]KGP73381.1 hypothetical protein N782_05580 [Pontibacillus yanchengensis Y32]
MHVFAAFESNEYVEMAIGEIIEHQFPREHIVFVEMNNEEKQRTLVDTINYSDGMSFSDTTATFATIGMLLGVIYGSVLFLGPVFIGLIGLVLGGGIGYFFDKRKEKQKLKRRQQEMNIRTLFVIQCKTFEEVQLIQEICRKYFVSYLGVYNREKQSKKGE